MSKLGPQSTTCFFRPDKPVYFATRQVEGYQDTTEPNKYPELYSEFYHVSELGKHKEAAEKMAALISHALSLGYLGTGSTRAWANDVLEEYIESCPALNHLLLDKSELKIDLVEVSRKDLAKKMEDEDEKTVNYVNHIIFGDELP